MVRCATTAAGLMPTNGKKDKGMGKDEHRRLHRPGTATVKSHTKVTGMTKRNEQQQKKKKKKKKDGSLTSGPSRLPTAFEKRVYSTCSAIPIGMVSTYGTIAKLLESSPRAVGQALGRNPFAPEVPCHRVIAGTLQLGGFQGVWAGKKGTADAADHQSVVKKRALLAGEKVKFDGQSGQLVDPWRAMDAKELRPAAEALWGTWVPPRAP
jgi:methylated-DNA-[protein]-cysteine S-methyltransferase